MNCCRVCMQPQNNVRLFERDLSQFLALCSIESIDKFVWICTFCWKRVMQFLGFVETARQVNSLLQGCVTSSPLLLSKNSLHSYKKHTLPNVTVCTLECNDVTTDENVPLYMEVETESDHFSLLDAENIIKKEDYVNDVKEEHTKEEDVNDLFDLENNSHTDIFSSGQNPITLRADPRTLRPQNVIQTSDLTQKVTCYKNSTASVLNTSIYRKKGTSRKTKCTKKNNGRRQDDKNGTVSLSPSLELQHKRPIVREPQRAQQLNMVLVELNDEQQREEVARKKESERYRKCLLPCHKCGLAFNEEDPYYQHNRKWHSKESGENECQVCGYRFKARNLLQKHMTDHRRRWRCLRCHSVISKRDWYSHHNQCVERAEYKCDLCDKTYKASSSLRNHKRIIHSKTYKMYECHHCSRVFVNRMDVICHLRDHQNLRPYKCEVCDKTFTGRKPLKYHEATHRTEDPEEERFCVECGKLFRTKRILIMHLTQHKAHVVDKMFKCHDCSASFVHSRDLEYHVKSIHTGQRDFKCHLCDKAYPMLKTLRRHTRLKHSEQERRRDHVCNVCGSAFYSRQTLRDHISAVHEKLRPFKCDICGENFGFKAALYTHRRLKHKVRKLRQVCTNKQENSEVKRVSE